MQNKQHHKPPRLAMALFRWFCHPAHREEIEGDLVEQFNRQVQVAGAGKARFRFIKEVLLLFRPSIIFNYRYFHSNHTGMKTKEWARLVLINLFFAVLVLIPFIPGPFSKLTISLSFFARAFGFFGILLIPVALAWFTREIITIVRPGSLRNNWSNGYYFAIIAAIIGSMISTLVVFLSAHEYGRPGLFIALLIIGFSLRFIIPAIRRLKRSGPISFNPVPLYLLSIPLVVFVMQLYVVLPVSHFSREYIIERSQTIIEAIEEYKIKEGDYPASLDVLAIASTKPGTMGVSKFTYEKHAEGYNLYFVQWQHFGATREVVMYNKNEEYNVKGHFASFDAGKKHWKYYWLD